MDKNIWSKKYLDHKTILQVGKLPKVVVVVPDNPVIG